MISKINQHRKTLKELAKLCGNPIANGKRISKKLELIESRVIRANSMRQEDKENFNEAQAYALKNVQMLFNNNLEGLFISPDLLGYALKIEPDATLALQQLGIYLQRDIDGYGILSPKLF
jgi:hypothetical protein